MVNPESRGQVSRLATHGPLLDWPRGRPFRIAGLPPALADDLVAEGLAPGAVARVDVQAPFGGPLLVRVGRARVAISAAVAAAVEVAAVEPLEPPP
ncbi:MAG: FeoA family protein [Chloroflexota bacterium]